MSGQNGITRPGSNLLLCNLLLCLALLVPATAGAQHFAADEDIEIMLRYLVEDGETPGIVLGILEADGSTRILSYGSAGPDARPLGTSSVFEIGSINKTFTGILLADMVVRGEVALEDPVAKYLPDDVTVPSRNGREITLLDLTTHTSGLPRLPDNHEPADPQDPYADYTVEMLYEFLSGHELRRDPGAEFEYSNLGVGLLGHALARAGGMSYRELLRERVLDPFGMEMTGYALEGQVAEWMTRGHRAGDVVPYWFATEAIQGAGGLRSNIEDMLTYLKANVSPPETELGQAIRLSHESRTPSLDDPNQLSGLGWGISSVGGRKLLQHGGGTGGFSTFIGFDPELGVGIVRLTNTTEFGDDIARDFLRRGPPLDIAEVTVDPEVLARYVGEYSPGSERGMVVRLEEEGYLTMQAPGNVRFRMYAESDTSFFVKRTPWRFAFRRDESGEVVEVALDLEGNRRTARRVGDEGPAPAVVAGNARPPAPPMPAEEIAPYEGTYLIEVGGQTRELRVFGEDGGLVAEPAGQGPMYLQRTGDHEFTLAADSDIRLVFTVEGDRAESVTIHQGGRTMTGERKP